MKKSFLTGISLLLIVGGAHGGEPSNIPSSALNPALERTGTPPDNTNVNKRDRDERTLTPLDQSLSKGDQEITQTIRKSIMEQDLSMNGKNVKIITQNGEVTLRGPVESRAEVQTIVKIAKAVHGVKTIHNQLEVKS